MGAKAVTLEDVRKALVPVLKKQGAKRAILFGSYARGEADEWSDIDLLIVAQTRRPFIERFKDFSELWRVSPVKAIDVLVYTPEEFERLQAQKHTFVSQAVEDGQVIYAADR